MPGRGPAAGAVFLNGTVGVGKTTVASAVGELLVRAEVAHAVLDVDALRHCWPAPPDDRFNTTLAVRNLRAVAATFVEAGMTRLVLAGVIETPAERIAVAEALGVPLVVCRLRADLAVVRERLLRRHADDEPGLAWHLARAPELHAVLEAADVDDVTLDVSTTSPQESARRVVGTLGW